MCSCIATLQPMLNTSMPAPARNATTTSGSTCGSSPSISSGHARTTRSRASRRAAVAEPHPEHDHASSAAARRTPRRGRAPSRGRRWSPGRAPGPRVNQAPGVDRVHHPEAGHHDPQPGVPGEDRPALAQLAEHARARRLRAARRERAPGSAAGRRPARSARRRRAPSPSRRRPPAARPTVGPMTVSPAREKDSSALACWRWVRGASCGTMPVHRRHGERRHGAVGRLERRSASRARPAR